MGRVDEAFARPDEMEKWMNADRILRVRARRILVIIASCFFYSDNCCRQLKRLAEERFRSRIGKHGTPAVHKQIDHQRLDR